MKTLCVTIALLSLAGLSLAAVPDAARKASPDGSDGTASTTLGAKKLATANQCSGAVAFSGVGLAAAPKSDKPLGLQTTLLDKGVGWKPEDGEFICYCPGTYQFAFAGDATAKLMLKKRAAAAGSPWVGVVSGPQHVVLLDVELGEAVALFLESGTQVAQAAGAVPSLSFSGFRVAKKQ